MSDASAPDAGLRELAAWAAAVRATDLPPAVRDKAKACLLYGLSVGIAAAGAALPHRVAKAEADAPGDGRRGARRLLDGRTVAPDAAAVANAVLLHVRIQEDAHPPGHVGVVVLPAALAAAEAAGADGPALIEAIVAGYEVALRVGRDHASDLSGRGFRTTSTYGAFGAAAAAGRLLGLDAPGMANALALAANAACGLREFVHAGTEEYAVQAGLAARNGLLAARLAAAGVGAAQTALEGKAGFYRAFGAREGGYGERLGAGLGSISSSWRSPASLIRPASSTAAWCAASPRCATRPRVARSCGSRCACIPTRRTSWACAMPARSTPSPRPS